MLLVGVSCLWFVGVVCICVFVAGGGCHWLFVVCCSLFEVCCLWFVVSDIFRHRSLDVLGCCLFVCLLAVVVHCVYCVLFVVVW